MSGQAIAWTPAETARREQIGAILRVEMADDPNNTDLVFWMNRALRIHDALEIAQRESNG
jgi:hypothetical protein